MRESGVGNRWHVVVRLGILLAGAALSACARATESSPPPVPPSPIFEEEGDIVALELASDAFAHEGAIPRKYTCDGEDLSPPLRWNDPPEGAKSFALIADDPDAPRGTWVHWVLFNVPAGTRAVPEGIPAQATLSDGSVHGKNSWDRPDYGGPCPPSGTHRYFFKLYALDATLDLEAGASVEQVLTAMQGHVLGQAEIMGVYSR